MLIHLWEVFQDSGKDSWPEVLMHVGSGGGAGEITPKAEEEREPRVSRDLSPTFLGPFLLGLLPSVSGACLSPPNTPLLPVAVFLTTHQYLLVPVLHPLLPSVQLASALLTGRQLLPFFTSFT